MWGYDDPKRKNQIDKAVFLIDGKWYALYGTNLYVNLDDLPTDQLNNLVPNNSRFDKPNNIVYVTDFQKTNRIKKNRWDGFAYLNLFYKTDTVKIKSKLTQNETPKQGESKYAWYNVEYYKPNGLPYAFIVQDNVYYIIKSRK
ncbi:MAG: hypothetical protein EOO96_25835 [Pedobacter sp.]|nr:MAG: hypothetical protein EOO96_25835 [Pedobacter sp.]